MKFTSIYKLITGLVLLMILIWFIDDNIDLSLSAFKQHRLWLDQSIQTHYAYSLFIFVVGYSLLSGVVPGASGMTMLGGYLFGYWLGTIICVGSATLGATIVFIIVKYASNSWVNRVPSKYVLGMKKGFQEDAMWYLFTLRLILVFPFMMVNIVAGVLQVPLRTFFITTLLGIVPGVFIYVSLGVMLHDLSNMTNFQSFTISPLSYFAMIGLGVMTLLPVVYRRWNR